jgi:hypothetical protein
MIPHGGRHLGSSSFKRFLTALPVHKLLRVDRPGQVTCICYIANKTRSRRGSQHWLNNVVHSNCRPLGRRKRSVSVLATWLCVRSFHFWPVRLAFLSQCTFWSHQGLSIVLSWKGAQTCMRASSCFLSSEWSRRNFDQWSSDRLFPPFWIRHWFMSASGRRVSLRSSKSQTIIQQPLWTFSMWVQLWTNRMCIISGKMCLLCAVWFPR